MTKAKESVLEHRIVMLEGKVNNLFTYLDRVTGMIQAITNWLGITLDKRDGYEAKEIFPDAKDDN